MPGLALLDALLRRVKRMGMMPTDAEHIVGDLRATLDALADRNVEGDGPSVGADVSELVGRLLVQAAGLSRTLGVEADATARVAGARLRAAVDAAVARAAADGLEPRDLPQEERLVAWPTVVSPRAGGHAAGGRG
jgi:hypothetical protein